MPQSGGAFRRLPLRPLRQARTLKASLRKLAFLIGLIGFVAGASAAGCALIGGIGGLTEVQCLGSCEGGGGVAEGSTATDAFPPGSDTTAEADGGPASDDGPSDSGLPGDGSVPNDAGLAGDGAEAGDGGLPSDGGGVSVLVTNGCPVDLWIHGAGQEGTLLPDDVQLAPDASQYYVAPSTWSVARISAYLGGPEQGQYDKVEMNFSTSNGVESMNTDITYVDWVVLPSQIQTIGSGSGCGTVGCEVSYSEVLSECPSSLLTQHECLSAGLYCVDSANSGDSFCHLLDTQVSACAQEYTGCADAGGSTTADVYSCAGPFFSTSPEYCAALNRGVLSAPGPDTAPSSFYQTAPFNPYAAWVHQTCPGIYAFPYDDYGSTNQSSDLTCSGATQLIVTFCPKG
jgi:hypothetical protein